MISLSRLFAITKKEVRQLRRDRLTFGMIVGIPVIQMLLFGYAINTDVRNLTSFRHRSSTSSNRSRRPPCSRNAFASARYPSAFSSHPTSIAA